MPEYYSDQYYKDKERNGFLDQSRLRSSLNDIKDLNFWRAVLAEFIATVIFNFSSVSLGHNDPVGFVGAPAMVDIAFGNGLAVATNIWIFNSVSGANFNPAVTLGLLVSRRVSLIRAVLYWVVQIVGAITGAGLSRLLVYEKANPSLGMTVPSARTSPIQACGLELIATMVFLLTILASVDEKRPDLGGSKPLSIGLAIVVGAFVIGPLSGGSMNPARSFGPCVYTGQWSYLWIYWVGPCAGAIIAALLYELFLSPQASPSRCFGCCIKGTYDPDTTKTETVDAITIREYENTAHHHHPGAMPHEGVVTVVRS